MRFTGRKFDTWMTSWSAGSARCSGRAGPAVPPVAAAVEEIRNHAIRGGRRAASRVDAQAVGHGGHAVRLFDRERHDLRYDGSLPTSVMSVPCSVVTMRAAGSARGEASICCASYAAVACGTA